MFLLQPFDALWLSFPCLVARVSKTLRCLWVMESHLNAKLGRSLGDWVQVLCRRVTVSCPNIEKVMAESTCPGPLRTVLLQIGFT